MSTICQGEPNKFSCPWKKYTCFFSIDLDPTDWERMKQENGWNSVQLRDNRYNQIIHMVSAANGAEPFYTIDGHNTRHEGLDTARKLDEITAAVCTCSALCLCIQVCSNERPCPSPRGDNSEIVKLY